MNMESLPKQEAAPNKIEKSKVLDMLRSNGFEHPETKELVIKWTEEQEALITKENTASARINFEIERSDLYLAIGDIDGALDCLEDARVQAHQENETVLYYMIMMRMNKIESGDQA